MSHTANRAGIATRVQPRRGGSTRSQTAGTRATDHDHTTHPDLDRCNTRDREPMLEIGRTRDPRANAGSLVRSLYRSTLDLPVFGDMKASGRKPGEVQIESSVIAIQPEGQVDRESDSMANRRAFSSHGRFWLPDSLGTRSRADLGRRRRWGSSHITSL
jgi:hypothetical protein